MTTVSGLISVGPTTRAPRSVTTGDVSSLNSSSDQSTATEPTS